MRLLLVMLCFYYTSSYATLTEETPESSPATTTQITTPETSETTSEVNDTTPVQEVTQTSSEECLYIPEQPVTTELSWNFFRDSLFTSGTAKLLGDIIVICNLDKGLHDKSPLTRAGMYGFGMYVWHNIVDMINHDIEGTHFYKLLDWLSKKIWPVSLEELDSATSYEQSSEDLTYGAEDFHIDETDPTMAH